jgi:hypothetical protein
VFFTVVNPAVGLGDPLEDFFCREAPRGRCSHHGRVRDIGPVGFLALVAFPSKVAMISTPETCSCVVALLFSFWGELVSLGGFSFLSPGLDFIFFRYSCSHEDIGIPIFLGVSCLISSGGRCPNFFSMALSLNLSSMRVAASMTSLSAVMRYIRANSSLMKSFDAL